MTIRDDAFDFKPVNVPVIDAHTHIGVNYCNGCYSAISSNSEVISLMDHLGIDCIVTSPQNHLLLGEVEQGNMVAADAASEYPGRIYGYISISPFDGIDGVRSEIEKYSLNKHFLGFKFLAGYHGPLAQPEYDYVLDFAQEMRCPVLSHCWLGNFPMSDIERAVEKRPGLNLIMAHQGGGYAEATDDYTALMKDYPNLYMEICGSLYNTYSVEDFVKLAGEDRVIYGSDLIAVDPGFELGRVTLCTLPDDTKRKILSENFLNLLKDSSLGKINLNSFV